MLRKLALLLIPLAVFAAACGSDDDSGDDPTPAPSATSAADSTGSPPGADADEPTAIVIATPDLGGAPIDMGDEGSDPGSIISAINPLSFLSGVDSGSASDGASPELAARLLSSGDLPAGYLPMGDFSMNFPMTAGSSMEMAMSWFASGDIVNTGQLGSMVISAAIIVPPEARSEMDIDELTNMTDEELQEEIAASGAMGMGITDVHILDASGLGEGGAGIHMEMDLAQMGDAFGSPPVGMPAELGTDMYMFFEGDYMQMVMVMYPVSEGSDVDARSLAEVLDNRSSGPSA
jgi:hypothetical protein